MIKWFELRLTYKMVAILIIFLIIAWALYTFLGAGLIESAYEGRSIGILNKIIDGTGENSVSYYQQMAKGLLLKMTLYTLVVCLFIILPSNFKLMMASLLVTLLIIEGFFFSSDFILKMRYPEESTDNEIIWGYDPILGWRNMPNTEAYYTNVKNRFRTMCKTNSKGLRDKEYPYEKKEGIKRILMIGDSGVAGFEVEQEYVIDSQLEKLVDQNGEYEVLNAGTRGYGTDQSYMLLESEGVKYQPDIVIYVFFYNDAENNISIHRPYRKYGKPYYIVGENGELELKGVPVPEEFKPFNRWMLTNKEAEKFYNVNLESSHEYFVGKKQRLKDLRKKHDLASLVRKDYLKLMMLLEKCHTAKWASFKIRHIKSLEQAFVKAGIMAPHLNEQTPDDLPEFIENYKWTITEKLIEKMSDKTEEVGAKLLVYEFSSNGRNPVPTRLSQVCDKLGIAYHNSFEELKTLSKGKKVFHYPYDEHWNEKGHALAAKGIYKFLTEQKWLDKNK